MKLFDRFGPCWKYIFLPFTIIYSTISGLKNIVYDWKILRPRKVNIPVISIGNLTVGGTGKTPIVAFIANELEERGIKVGIVSRGYKRETTGTKWVSKNGEILMDAISAGDEPVELAATVKFATVVVGDTRYEAAVELLKGVPVDVILIDDGMQHRKFFRHVEIVVQDISSATQNKFQLPSGPFRESWKNCQRADVIIWTKWNEINTELSNEWKQYAPNAVQLWARFIPKEFYFVREKKKIPLNGFKEITAIAFCGIGQPLHFKNDLEKLGIHIVRFFSYPDHYSYQKQDLLQIIEAFKETRADFVFTTAKDYHRLAATQTSRDFMRYLPTITMLGSVEISSGTSTLMDYLTAKIDAI